MSGKDGGPEVDGDEEVSRTSSMKRRTTSIHEYRASLIAAAQEAEARHEADGSRRASLSSCSSHHLLPPQPQIPVSGILMDFFLRAQASDNIMSKSGIDVMSAILKEKMMGRQETSGTDDAGGVYHQASIMIDRDCLQFNILEVLTKFWKGRDKKRWPPFSKDVVKARGWEVVRHTQSMKCLRAEVKFWLDSHAQEHHPKREPEETLHDRQARLRGFWDEYQTSFRRLEVPLSMNRAASVSGLRSRSSARAAASPWPTAASGGNSPSSGVLRREEDSGRLPASLQASVKRSQSAGSLAASKGNSQPGSPKSNVNGSIYPRLIPVQDPLPELIKDTRLPPWAPPKWDPSPPRGKVLQVDRTSTLPPIADREVRVKDPLSKRYQRDNRAKGPVAFPVKQPPCSGGGQTPARKYVLECETNGIMPTPMPFITGHSLNFALWDKVLVDNDLMAATVALPTMAQIEEADLEGNRVLTDKSLVPFLQKLATHPAIWSLKKLSLKYCVQAGKATLDSIANLLGPEDGATKLRYLNLGGMSISTKIQKKLCEAIMQHPHLKTVHLADVGLGASSCTRECVGCLMSSRSIKDLDLGWNCFSAEVFEHLGERLVENQQLHTLSVANCSEATNKAGDAPVLYFLEHLSNDESLTDLDVSLNRLSFCGGLMLEDTLQNHKRLVNLHVSHNPLGVFGVRSALRLLLRTSTGLLHFHCDGCTNGPTSDPFDTETQIFNPNNPGGRYCLDLQRPYHRAILRMLYKTMERFKCAMDVAFQDISFSAPPYVHPSKDKRGNWSVPDSGKLTVTFSIEKSMEAGLKKLNDNSDFREVVEEHYNLTRLPPPFKKTIPLFALWRELDGRLLEQTTIADALSKDFRLTYPQVVQLCQSKSVTSEVIRKLLHAVVGGAPSRYFLMLQAASLGEFIKNYKAVEFYLTWNVDNPTGHYRLNLAIPSEHTVAEQLLLLDRWEAVLARRKGRFPVSQRGNHTQIRNEHFQDRKLNVQTIDQWKMPEFDRLEIDYVCGRRPPANAEELDEATFENFMATLHSSTCSHTEIIKVLRVASSNIYCTAMHLRGLLGIFCEDHDRADVFVLFYMRIVDMHNEKVFRVRFADKPEELAKLRKRLGATTLFPFVQPEQAAFELDLAIHDERLCASIMLELASKESPLMNIRNPSYIHEDGTRDPLTTGVPRSWATFEKCPTGGTFKVQYECSPEDRCFAHRLKLMETYGFWTCRKAEEEVMWWAALAEAPSDVLEFLEFLVGRFDDIYDSFTAIDGTDGNGQISLREFEDGVRILKCNKFKGRGEKERIANVFRYLDPSGEGQVSRSEWSIMDNLWKEMRQSIREFVFFLERTFGGQDTLDEAWSFIDEDESGEIDEKEWVDVVHDRLKYFGPSAIIFQFLDKDDEGTVSQDEFRTLKVFQKHFREEDEAKASLQGSVNASPRE